MNNEIIIKKLGRLDITIFEELIEIFKESDQAHPEKLVDQFSLNTMLHRNSFVVMVAMIDNVVVAGLTAFELPSYNLDESEIVIYSLAVLNNHKRLGIGKKLIESLKEYAKANGITSLLVATRISNPSAVEFYRSLGATEKMVPRFSYDLK